MPGSGLCRRVREAGPIRIKIRKNSLKECEDGDGIGSRESAVGSQESGVVSRCLVLK